MTLNKIRKFVRRYNKRIRNFYSSTISGLFTGVVIAILFNLITDSTFNRWINLFSYERFAAIIYFLFILFILWILYLIGKLFMYLFITRKKDELVGFRINFFAGIYSAVFSSLLVMLSKDISLLIIVGILSIIGYFSLMYLIVKD